jgi:hypothetical protein
MADNKAIRPNASPNSFTFSPFHAPMGHGNSGCLIGVSIFKSVLIIPNLKGGINGKG